MDGIAQGSGSLIPATAPDVNRQNRGPIEAIADSEIERHCRDFVAQEIVSAADHVGAAKRIVADLRRYADKLERRIK
jgi:hypothetical protein